MLIRRYHSTIFHNTINHHYSFRRTIGTVSIATRYGLDGPGIESRWGARFSAPLQTSPGAYPASCTMGTGSFPGVKWPGRGDDHPPPSKCRGQERVGLYLYTPSGPSWPVMRAPLPLLAIHKSHSYWPLGYRLKCRLHLLTAWVSLTWLTVGVWFATK